MSNNDETTSINSSVSSIIIHPDWNIVNESYDADISIAVLVAHVDFSDNIQAICLPKSNEGEVSGTGILTGWGKSERSDKSYHDTLPSKLEIPAINASFCYPTFPALSKYSSHRMFCGGYKNESKAPCSGDSGGGLYFMHESKWIIRGIVSGGLLNGNFGCDIDRFSLYTNVARFVDWIKENMAASPGREFIEFTCKYFKTIEDDYE